jgi:hypothetical protein
MAKLVVKDTSVKNYVILAVLLAVMAWLFLR